MEKDEWIYKRLYKENSTGHILTKLPFVYPVRGLWLNQPDPIPGPGVRYRDPIWDTSKFRYIVYRGPINMEDRVSVEVTYIL